MPPNIQGWISIYRSVTDSWVWKEKPFSIGQAWIDLLLMANHKDNKFYFRGQLITVKRGSLITSELKLMKRWGWGNTKVRNFLKNLESDGMIKHVTAKTQSTIYIENYGVYQGMQSTDKVQTKYSQSTDKVQTNTNNNINNYNNDNNENNNYFCATEVAPKKTFEVFERLWSEYPVKRNKSNVRDRQRKKIEAIGYDRMHRAIQNYIDDKPDYQERLMNGDRFFNSGYEDYIEETTKTDGEGEWQE